MNKMDEKILNNHIASLEKDTYNYGYSIDIDELTTLLTIFSDSYYNTGTSLISDIIFDELLDILKKRDPSNDFFKKVGADVPKDKIKLPYYMGSMDKIKNPDVLQKWMDKFEGPFVLSRKLDGVSGLLCINSKKNTLYTRGDGTYGQDISKLIDYIIPSKVKLDKLPKGLMIRGEIIISKENFKKIAKYFATNEDTILKNARNTVS